MKDLESQFPENIHVTSNRRSTIWGGASLLSMITGCFKDLLQMPWEWDFVLNLSESDYPLKKKEDLALFLTRNREKNFLLFQSGLETPEGRAKYVGKQGKLISNLGLDIFMYICIHIYRLYI
jgi:hypothetical protein